MDTRHVGLSTPIYLSVTTPPLTLKATCLERDKHRDPFRIGSNIMSKRGVLKVSHGE